MQDEWFHVPQTQRYCKGDLGHWDPKITTFPGLYLLAAPYAKAVTLLQSSLSIKGEGQEPCSTGVLRSFNVVMAAVFFAIVNQLYRRLHLRSSSHSPALMVSPSHSPNTGAHHRPQHCVVLCWRCTAPVEDLDLVRYQANAMCRLCLHCSCQHTFCMRFCTTQTWVLQLPSWHHIW